MSSCFIIHPNAAAYAAALESPTAGLCAPHDHRGLRAREDGAFALADCWGHTRKAVAAARL